MFQDRASSETPRQVATAPSDNTVIGQMGMLHANLEIAPKVVQDLEAIADRLCGSAPEKSSGDRAARIHPSGLAGGISEANEKITNLFMRINQAIQRINHHIG